MFHEVTDKELKNRRRGRILLASCIAIALAVVVALTFVMQTNAREQGATALRESIMTAAKQCCAIEGSYPSSLEHLEKNYGLSINHDDYVVSYESFAGNIMPTVVVTPR